MVHVCAPVADTRPPSLPTHFLLMDHYCYNVAYIGVRIIEADGCIFNRVYVQTAILASKADLFSRIGTQRQ